MQHQVQFETGSRKVPLLKQRCHPRESSAEDLYIESVIVVYSWSTSVLVYIECTKRFISLSQTRTHLRNLTGGRPRLPSGCLLLVNNRVHYFFSLRSGCRIASFVNYAQ
eukprot:12915-Heterococcus_DN1.PRE.1